MRLKQKKKGILKGELEKFALGIRNDIKRTKINEIEGKNKTVISSKNVGRTINVLEVIRSIKMLWKVR